MALDDVLSDLENEGYACQAFVIPACAVNAPHKRDRVWIVAHSAGYRMDGPARKDGESQGVNHQKNRMDVIGKSEVVADAHCHEQHRRASDVQVGRVRKSGETKDDGQPGRTERSTQPGMGDVAHGLPGRLDGHFDSEPAHIPRIATGIPQRAARLKALGNAIVPQVAYEILQHL